MSNRIARFYEITSFNPRRRKDADVLRQIGIDPGLLTGPTKVVGNRAKELKKKAYKK